MVDERPAETFRSPLSTDANAGRVAIVTGGGTGIGRAIAIELARTGASVAICGRRPEPIARAREALEATGAGVLAAPCDVREPEQVSAFLDAVDERFGRVDILVNNAGGQFSAPLEATSLKGLRAVHRLNVDAPWDLTTRVATRWMIPARRGFVAFIGFSPRRGIPTVVHSSIARSALETFAAGIALEWSKYGIRAVTVSCGLIRSEGLLAYGGESLVDEWAETVPLKRAGLAEEVAATIAFLASDGAGYITGSTVVVDGGADAWGLGERPPDLEPPPG
jgi:citronellol/citronellal dehydrogenase